MLQALDKHNGDSQAVICLSAGNRGTALVKNIQFSSWAVIMDKIISGYETGTTTSMPQTALEPLHPASVRLCRCLLNCASNDIGLLNLNSAIPYRFYFCLLYMYLLIYLFVLPLVTLSQ